MMGFTKPQQLKLKEDSFWKQELLGFHLLTHVETT